MQSLINLFINQAEILEGADAWELDSVTSTESGQRSDNLTDNKDKFSKLN